jgi:fused signal recognition particle receptor
MAETREGFWGRVAGRTRELLAEGLRGAGTPMSDTFYEELEELLLASDFGPQVAQEVTERVRFLRPNTTDMARSLIESELVRLFTDRPRWLDVSARPSCVLVYGVNGAGKTTTVGKLAHGLKQDGRRVLLVAADTYRAAGIEQALVWADRAGVEAFAGKPGGDPAAVVFDALRSAAARGIDVVLVDTAGRLQTQQNLLQELAKVGRVAGRALEGAPHESLLVLDGTLGQSSLSQARGFNDAVPISGLVLAKMDGTARGGAVLPIERALDVPTKMIGVGEGIADLYAFDPERFVAALFERPRSQPDAV